MIKSEKESWESHDLQFAPLSSFIRINGSLYLVDLVRLFQSELLKADASMIYSSLRYIKGAIFKTKETR